MKLDLFTEMNFLFKKLKGGKSEYTESNDKCYPDDWCWPQSGSACGPGPEGCWPAQCTPERGPCDPCSPTD